MTPSDFESTWRPRIGEDATAKLHSFVRIVSVATLATPLSAVAAGALFGHGAVGDVLAAVCAVVCVGCITAFIRSQRSVAKAMSPWFGVEIRWLPRMTPERFDAWRQARGLMTPDERAGDKGSPDSS